MAETSGIIEQYAAHLEQKASGTITRFTLFFGFLGALAGGFPLIKVANPLVPSHLGYATLLLGASAGAFLGYRTGERRAIGPRLQAQLAIRQLQVEQSLLTSRAAAVAAAVQVQPAPVPVAPVLPVAPVAPAPLPVAPPPAPVQPAPIQLQPPVLQPEPSPVPVVVPEPEPEPAPTPLAPPPVPAAPLSPPPAALAPPPLLSPAPPLSSAADG